LTAIVRGGLTAIAYSTISGVIGSVDAGVGARAWLSPRLSLMSTVSSDWAFGAPDRERVLALHGSAGLVWNVADRVTLALGAGWSGGIAVRDVDVTLADGSSARIDDAIPNGLLLGAVQALGYRPLPLMQVHVTDWLSVDAYATWGINLDDGDVRDRYLAGFTWTL